jgi:phosphoribosylanthranilate isomerase
MKKAKVKICGISKVTDALHAVVSGAWAIGFIFVGSSQRYIGPSKAREIVKQVRGKCITVGVFCNQSYEDVMRIVRKSGVDVVQLHGDEDPEYCSKFRLPVIKSINIETKSDLEKIHQYPMADLILLDGPKKNGSAGGNGQLIPIEILNEIECFERIIIAGGIDPKNIKTRISRISPYAYDLSSGVEDSPGVKNIKALKELFENIKPRMMCEILNA